MTVGDQRALALKIREIQKSEIWPVIEAIENEVYQDFKSKMVSNSYLYTVEQEGSQNRTVRKTPEQYGIEQAGTRGALDFAHALNRFRNGIIENLEKDEKENK